METGFKLIEPAVKYIIQQHKSFIYIYVYGAFHKRNINVQKIVKKLNEVYGENFTGEQFVEFGHVYLNDYLMEKHQISFDDLLAESFQPIRHRFSHLA